jgi:type IV pilus assembly protein PilO
MKIRFSKRDTIILAAVALVVVLVIVYAQFLKLSPLKSDLEIKQQSLENEQKLLEVLTQRKTDKTNQVVEGTRELQKVLPVFPLQEQLILDLEKAEAVSNSQILSMGFSKDAEVAMETSQPTAEGESAQETPTGQADQNAANQPETTQDAAATGDQAAQQPTGPTLKKLTVQLSVESPSYVELEKFVETLEALKRIVVVEAINYSGGQEVTTAEQQAQKLTYSLTISAFYMPDLADLAADLPKIDAPAPAGKTNPLLQQPSATNSQP